MESKRTFYILLILSILVSMIAGFVVGRISMYHDIKEGMIELIKESNANMHIEINFNETIFADKIMEHMAKLVEENKEIPP